jgi:hypothetical protein
MAARMSGMACITPGLIVPSDLASRMGNLAELRIAPEYLSHVGRPGFFPVPPAIDFFDISVGFGNNALYIAYLNSKHPHLSASQLQNLTDDALKKIPDIVTFDPQKRTEFYEIKPNNPDNIGKGKKKIAEVHALFQSFGLPYNPGIRWRPDTKIRLWSGGLMGIQVDVDFHFFYLLDGLILYELCAQGRTRPLTNAEVAVIIAAVIIVLLNPAAGFGGILKPAL